MIGAEFELINVQKSTKKIFSMSGVTRIIKINEKIEEIEEEIDNKIIRNLNKEDKHEGVI